MAKRRKHLGLLALAATAASFGSVMLSGLSDNVGVWFFVAIATGIGAVVSAVEALREWVEA